VSDLQRLLPGGIQSIFNEGRYVRSRGREQKSTNVWAGERNRAPAGAAGRQNLAFGPTIRDESV